MGRKKKVKEELPKLFPRRKKGILYFRLQEDEKDKWISTKTSDFAEAEKIRDTFIKTGKYAENISEDEINIAKFEKKVGEHFTRKIKGPDAGKIPIKDGEERWKDLKSDYMDLTESTKKQYSSIYKKFSKWCTQKNISFLEDVTREHAKLYDKQLWESKITARACDSHIKFLSQVFSTINGTKGLPYGNPFNHKNVSRRDKKNAEVVSHKPLEQNEVEKIIIKAAEYGEDFRDLIICGHQTGLRLKDSVFLQWDCLDNNFIRLVPFKTRKTKNKAIIPISPIMNKLLTRRSKNLDNKKYVFPKLVSQYKKNKQQINDTLTSIFSKALKGKKTIVPPGTHRKRHTAIYSYHSLRGTMMSLLAMKGVSVRDAQRIMCWSTYEMIELYENELEKAAGHSDARTKKMIESIDELKIPIPPCPIKLKPTGPILKVLVSFYTNTIIARVFDVTEAAVRKWLKKYEITREKPPKIRTIPEARIKKIRKQVLKDLQQA